MNAKTKNKTDALAFEGFYERALERKGSDALRARLPQVAELAEVAAFADDRWLSAMAMCVFSAGFTWRVVRAKWEGMEDAFDGFLPEIVARWDDSMVEALCQDRRLIRNPQKIRATIANARYVQQVAKEHGSFGAFVGQWPDADLVNLWMHFKKHGSRLGGATSARLLRVMGRDTFILSGDVVYALREAGVMTASASSQRGMNEAQAAFTRWKRETGLPMAHLSMIVSCSVDRPPEER